MAKSPALSPPKPPRELRPLVTALKNAGFILAIPFDDIRLPGYIGTFQNGKEIVIDDGKLLADYVTLRKRTVAIGDTAARIRFSLRGFLGFFGGLFGLDLRSQQTRNVSIRFPERLVPSKYITALDVIEDLHRLTPAQRAVLLDQRNFLIVQTLHARRVEYAVETRRSLERGTRESLTEKIRGQCLLSGLSAQVRFESDKSYSIVLDGKTMTVGYKRYRIPAPLD